MLSDIPREYLSAIKQIEYCRMVIAAFVQRSQYKNICLASENITVNLNHIGTYQVTVRIWGGSQGRAAAPTTFTCEKPEGVKTVTVLNSSNLSTSFLSFYMCLQCFLITAQFLNSHRNLNYNNHMHSFPQERKHLL